MVTGTVKFFNRTKRFGFIAGDDEKDYFVHATGLMPDVTIDEGDKVNFELSMPEEKIAYPGNRNFIQITCSLFSVPGNEGQRRAAVKQCYGGLDSTLVQGQLQRYFFNLRIGHIVSFLECRDQKYFGFRFLALENASITNSKQEKPKQMSMQIIWIKNCLL